MKMTSSRVTAACEPLLTVRWQLYGVQAEQAQPGTTAAQTSNMRFRTTARGPTPRWNRLWNRLLARVTIQSPRCQWPRRGRQGRRRASRAESTLTAALPPASAGKCSTTQIRNPKMHMKRGAVLPGLQQSLTCPAIVAFNYVLCEPDNF